MSDYMEMEADILEERYGLALQRIKEIPGEHLGQDSLEDYFSFCAGFAGNCLCRNLCRIHVPGSVCGSHFSSTASRRSKSTGFEM